LKDKYFVESATYYLW